MTRACRRAAWILQSLAAATTASLHAAEKPATPVTSIAVLPLAAKSKADPKQVSVLDDLLLSALQQHAEGMRVLGQSDVDRLLGFEKVKDAAGCNEVSCAVEIAGALGVDSLVYGSVGRVGAKQVVSLTWIHQRDGRVLGRDSEVVSSDEQLIDAVGLAVSNLFAASPPPAATAGVASPAPAAQKPAALSTAAYRPLSPPVPERSGAGNLALNTAGQGFPSPLESDAGWGGGSRPWDLVDGRRTYGSDWARGLAFTGGPEQWAGARCGTRHVVIDFGERRRFNRVIVWHHGADQAPKACRVTTWDGAAWSEVFATERARDLLAFETASPKQWWESWSVPMDIRLPVSSGAKVRFSFDNCDIPHGWIYELEIYDEAGR